MSAFANRGPKAPRRGRCPHRRAIGPCGFALGPPVTIALLLLAPMLPSMDWPSQNAILVRNFGWNNQGRPLLGDLFQGEGPLRAAEAGTLVFFHRSSNTAATVPSPLGSWMALEHPDGIISIYSRFEDRAPPLSSLIEKDTVIAVMGVSGWSDQGGYGFSLFDRREGRWVNPSTLLSPLRDRNPPQIHSVTLRNDQGRSIDPAQTKTIRQGRYSILVQVSDTQLNPNESPLAPYRLFCSVNGIDVGTLTFETFSTQKGVLMIDQDGPLPAVQVYGPQTAYEMGRTNFSRGQAAVELIAQDMAGNTRSVLFRLQVE